MRDLAAGTLVDGRYRIVTRLGSGGMADVYCAEDEQLGRRVALKVLYSRYAQDAEFVERFRREASHAAGLQHQHVVSVYDRGEWEGTSYIAMEFVDGRTLNQIIRAEAPMDPLRAIDLTVQVLRAARFAHRRGVVHRDLKPHNVIVEENGHPSHAKVTDFGIARAGASDMTQTGSIMGTARYLSPEQAQGQQVTPRSDLYSIGICLYEMLAGRVPFEGESAVTIALKQVSEAPVPPSHYNAAVPAALEDAVLRALAKDPEQRFPDADAFIAALEEARALIEAGSAAPAQPTAAFAPVAPALGTAVAPAAVEEVAVAHEPVAAPADGGPRWPWLLLVSALLVAAAVGILALTGVIGAPKVRVPGVVGTQSSAAAAVLHRASLEVSIDRVNDDTPRGTVISQNPQPGTRVKQGTTVNLSVSDGPGTAQVPLVDGLARRAARMALTKAGFKVREQSEASDTVPKGRVTRTQPTGGDPLEIGSVVTIYVSTGPPDVSVPAVTGKPLDEARAILGDAGFQIQTSDRTTTTDKPGTVLEQSPAAGTPAPKGSVVTLAVARAPDRVDVPDVTGQTDADATRALSAAGFVVDKTTEQVGTPAEDGIVVSQTPKGGRKAKPGSTVTIVVGSFQPNLNPDGTQTTPPPPPGAR